MDTNFRNQLDLALNSIGSNEKSILKLLTKIAEIPSPTGQESRKIDFLKNKLGELGYQNAKIDKIGNCILEIPGASKSPKKTILITAHADTACDPGKNHKITEDKKYFYGHGVCDNSAGVTGLLTLLQLLKEYQIIFLNNLIVAFTVGEEGLGAKRGMKTIIKKYGEKIDAVINVESHNIGRVTNQAIGQYRSEIIVNTKSGGHSFRDFGRPNAIVILSQIINDFSKYKIPKSKGKITWNVGSISGEGSINAIPKLSSCLFEIRSENNNSLKQMTDKLLSIMEKYKKIYPDIDISTTIIAENPATKYPDTHKLYKLTIEAQKTLKISPKIDSGNTDGDVSLAAGIPTVTIGTSIGFNTHSLRESMEKKPLNLGIKQVFLVASNVVNNI